MVNSLPRGSRLGVDAGLVRIGVSASDPDGLMAFPVATVVAGSEAVNEIVEVIRDRSANCVYVGSPISLSGSATASTNMAHTLAEDLRIATAGIDFDLEIRLVDERLSTVSAAGQLREAGHNSKSSKAVVDQAAAVVILEHALDIESRSGARAGTKVGE